MAATLVLNVEGTVLRSRSFFAYYMLVALEAGGPLRALLLLAFSPLFWALETLLSATSAAIRLQIFLSTAGLHVSQIQAVSRAVLPKFFLEDLHPSTFRSLIAASDAASILALSAHPRLFLHHFFTSHLLLPPSSLVATELLLTKSGICTGLVSFRSGLLDESGKVRALRRFYAADSPSATPLIGVSVVDGHGRQHNHHAFLSYCKDIMFLPNAPASDVVRRDEYLTPLVFHDGRLVMRPTPLTSLAVLLWMPIGAAVAVARILVGLTLPGEVGYPVAALLGLKLRVTGAPPLLGGGAAGGAEAEAAKEKEGVLFVCSHRSLADPTFLTLALRRKVRALAYSVSKVSEFIAPIKMTRLTRKREVDAKIIDELLTTEDLFVCPEGTTCREPYLLRFSPLFAELSERVVPVALNTHVSFFHGTTARGYKFLDAFFFLMNPRPFYHVSFLPPISISSLRTHHRLSTIDIANLVQKRLADALGFTCTNFNRRDKYTLLAGHDGYAVFSADDSAAASSATATASATS